MRTVLDLFSGTGNATDGFRRRTGWRVVTVDNSPARRPDVVADVRALPFRTALGRVNSRGGRYVKRAIDVIWASPPCTEFSDATPLNRTRRPSLELVCATLEAVATYRPRFWMLENVRGAIPFLGIPAQKVGPWCLWGYFPRIDATFEAQTWRKGRAGSSAVARAAVPLELAEAVARSVEAHWSVRSLLDLRPFRAHRHVARRELSEPGRSAPDLFAISGPDGP